MDDTKRRRDPEAATRWGRSQLRQETSRSSPGNTILLIRLELHGTRARLQVYVVVFNCYFCANL